MSNGGVVYREAKFDAGYESGAYKVSRTGPDVLIRHDISDEELTVLISGDISKEKEIKWVALGASLGALTPAISSARKLWSSPSTFTFWDLADCLVFTAGLIVFILMLVLSRKQSGTVAVAEQIRTRTQQFVK